MNFYELRIGSLVRKLPVVFIAPKVGVASMNLLGDRELVEYVAKRLFKKVKSLDFDFLVGPEVKVVPLLQELSKILRKDRYVVLRKEIHGYMISPIKSKLSPGLILDGFDASLIKGKKVVIVDDVVSSGHTLRVVEDLIKTVSAKVVARISIFCQGDKAIKEIPDLIYLHKLPIFAG